MKYINKSPHRHQGNFIIDQMLDNHWVSDEEYYSNVDYDSGICDSRATYKNDLTDVILENQGNLCCYCMKTIETTDTTLEHIIPHHSNKAECREYFLFPILVQNVIHRVDFNKYTKIPPQGYPHDIAYDNLVASCNDDGHCNHKRGDTFIRPLFYDVNIDNAVEYDEHGRIHSEKYSVELHTLGLDSKKLTTFRKIWKLLCTKSSIDVITDEIIDITVSKLFADTGSLAILNDFIGDVTNGVPSKMGELKKYKWFFHYYGQP